METIYLNRENLLEWQGKAKKNVMALGFFDGLHLGHCEVIKTAFQKAKEKKVSLAVMSFFPHPKTVLSNGKKQVCYLMPPTEKEKMLKKLGVDTFYFVKFDPEFASLSPEEFVANYLNNLGVIHAVAGFDFTYGHKGKGNMERLKIDSGGLIETTMVEKIECRGEKISSTCIRERLLQGKVEEIPDFLGHPYEVKGNWNGEELILQPYYTLPAPGRYVVTVNYESQSIHTEVSVHEHHGKLTLTLLKKMPRTMRGSISIKWHYSCLNTKESAYAVIG